MSAALPPLLCTAVSGVTATIFGCSGFLARYLANALGNSGGQLVLPYRCDDTDVQHLRTMGDLGQVVMLPNFRWVLCPGAGAARKGRRVCVRARSGSQLVAAAERRLKLRRHSKSGCQPPNPPPSPPSPSPASARSIRDEELVRRAISRSNLVINCVGAQQVRAHGGLAPACRRVSAAGAAAAGGCLSAGPAGAAVARAASNPAGCPNQPTHSPQ